MCRQQDIQNSNADLAVVKAQTGQREMLAKIEADNKAIRRQVSQVLVHGLQPSQYAIATVDWYFEWIKHTSVPSLRLAGCLRL